jgi:hypothetical protein
MTRTFFWDPNTLVMPLGHGRVRLFQPVAQRNVVATLAILEVADLLSGGREETDLLACHSRLGDRLCAADASCFTLWDHAYCNPDFYDGRVAAEPLEPAPFEEFLELLLDANIVADCWPPQYDLVKRGFGDRFKGSFYEQVGTQCLWERTVPTQWWLGQKFTPDAAETRPTPYRYVQEAFLDGYFPAALAGKEVLEVGCGSGYYTRKMSAHARTAVGMDYNADYVAVAREKWPPSAYPNLEFHVGNIIDLAAGSVRRRGVDRHLPVPLPPRLPEGTLRKSTDDRGQSAATAQARRRAADYGPPSLLADAVDRPGGPSAGRADRISEQTLQGGSHLGGVHHAGV